MMEVLAGIDPSTSTGICIMQDGIVVHADVLKIKKPGWDNGRAYALFADSLWALFVRFNVQQFAVETKIPGGQIASNANTHDIATVLFGRCEEIASRLNLKMHPVHVQSWRSTFLRKATIKAPAKDWFEKDGGKTLTDDQYKAKAAAWRRRQWKRDALSECERRGWVVKNDDVAEACGIAAHLRHILHPLGLDGANSLFELPETKKEQALTFAGARSEADRVFANFSAETAD